MATVLELTFQKACVHLEHDAQRLEDGRDLNDALLDFFVKLGQVLIPEGGVPPSVAYLGSHFYDVLRKGGAKDGRTGHKNVAKWAHRRLGKGGLFSDSVGALAVPVNEVLRESYDGSRRGCEEKHWWLALLLNPRAVNSGLQEDVSLLCLDSFVRAETRYDPPVRACKSGGLNEAYSIEVDGLSRIGFCVNVSFRAQGDGSAGGLAQPGKAKLRAGGRTFASLEQDLKSRDRGGEGRPGRFEGSLGFRLDRRGAAKTVGEYTLQYGEQSDEYHPALRLRMGEKPTSFQAQVSRFLGGYLARERATSCGIEDEGGEDEATRLEAHICLPGVPQQETSHDCGFFILEQILRALQLPAKALRDLATASSVEIAMLPWPSQKQVLRRKSRLRDAMGVLFLAARKAGSGNVEALLQADDELRLNIRDALLDGASFMAGFNRWEAGDWDLSASPSRSRSRTRVKAKSKRSRSTSRSYTSSGPGRKMKKKKRRRTTTSESSSRSRRRRRNRSRSSNSRRSSSRSGSPNRVKPGQSQVGFTIPDLEASSAGALRKLCIERGVLPEGIVERTDLLRALAPLADAAAPPSSMQKTQTASLPVPEIPSSMLAGKSFTRQDLEAMTSKALRALCVHRGVLPGGPIERGDLICALAPLGAPG
eukprot:TRINITY_DN29536_c0_g1_i2.p1 TRINITY_DN29536_c0_g1~~TRINITY_DN29536_c0_g1_i2.p1  ORF type:complete len:649 (+),score=109.51 TRINITY_DN29536_c0_g1_i2:120-2066(+)